MFLNALNCDDELFMFVFTADGAVQAMNQLCFNELKLGSDVQFLNAAGRTLEWANKRVQDSLRPRVGREVLRREEGRAED